MAHIFIESICDFGSSARALNFVNITWIVLKSIYTIKVHYRMFPIQNEVFSIYCSFTETSITEKLKKFEYNGR